MSMKKRVILMVAGLLLLIAAVVVVMVHNKNVADNEPSSSSSAIVYANLVENDKENIASITIKTEKDELTFLPSEHTLEGNLTWVLQGHEDWTLIHNYQEIISMGTTFQVYKMIEENVTDLNRLDEFGLKDPTSIVTVVLKDGTVQEFHIGNSSSDHSYVFCQMVGDDTIYAGPIGYRTYSTYTRNTIRLPEITEIDTEAEVVSLFMEQRGYRPVQIVLDEEYAFKMKSGETVYLRSPYKFEEPYQNEKVMVAYDLEREYLSNLTTPEMVMTIDADCEDFSPYHLGDDDYMIRETIVTRTGQEGNYTYNTTDYLFGDIFGDDGEFIYFREANSNHVMGVDVSCLASRRFKPFEYVNRLIFLNPITNVKSGTVDLNGRVYTFEIEREEVDEDSYVDAEDRLTVYTVNGSLVEADHFASFYRMLIEIAPDYEIQDEEPEYDKNDYLIYTFYEEDGSVDTIEFYRMSEFYYVTQIDDATWFAVAASDITAVAEKMDLLDQDIETYGAK